MKKAFYAIAILAVAAAAFTGCKKDDDKKKDEKIVKRVAMCGDKWDKYYFTYDEDGRIKEVNRNPNSDGGYERTWTFNWTSTGAVVNYVKEGEEKPDITINIGENGYISSYTDEYGDTRYLTYDSDGYLTQVKKGDEVKSNIIVEDGNYVKWSRFSSGAEQFKIQTFLKDDNIGGIHPDYADKTDPARWFYEIGLCGKASKKLLDQAVWDGSESIAVHTYEKDDDGYVTTVSKVYGTGEPELYYYEWEVVKKK